MRATGIYNYYAFGYNYHILQYDTEGMAVRGPEGQQNLASMIDEFFERVEELDLPVTSKAAKDLREIRKRLESLPADTEVDQKLAQEVTDACERLDVTLDSELKLRTAFVVTPKRFDQRHLLNQPERLVSQDTWSAMSDIARFDLASAGRAIAFGLSTAAAFHLMRCVEETLRNYYRSIVKRERVDPLLWSPMIKHLRRRRDAPPRALLDHLDNIRVNFRNPTQHPDARYELEEAQDLLAVSIDALNRMARNLAERT